MKHRQQPEIQIKTEIWEQEQEFLEILVNSSDFSIKEHFTLPDENQNEKFKVYLWKKDNRHEFVILNGSSNPHVHTDAIARFRFASSGELGLGGLDMDGKMHISYFLQQRGDTAIIAPYVGHSVRPDGFKNPVKLLIFNESAPRQRNTGGYTEDTKTGTEVIEH